MHKKTHKGFTLLELIIVVAIIAIISVTAIPSYVDYTIKSQAVAALSEITPGKLGFELAIQNDKTPSTNSDAPGFIGVGEKTVYCSITLSTDSIACKTKGGNVTSFNDQDIIWTRSASSNQWVCTTTLDSRYKPGKCT